MSKRKHDEDSQDGGEKKHKKSEGKEERGVHDGYPHVNGALCHIEIPVPDLAKSKKFYMDALGWEILEDFSSAAHEPRIIFKAGSLKCVCPSIVKSDSGPKDTGIWIYCSNAAEMSEKIFNAGGVVTSNLARMPIGDAGQAVCKDVAGNSFKLIQHNGVRENVETKNFTVKVSFAKLSAEDVWSCFSDSKKHAELTKQTVECDLRLGGLMVTGNSCFSRFIELEQEPKKKHFRMTQSWRLKDNMPQGHFCETSFDFKGKKSGCEVSCEYRNVPSAMADAMPKMLYEGFWDKLGEGARPQNFKYL